MYVLHDDGEWKRNAIMLENVSTRRNGHGGADEGVADHQGPCRRLWIESHHAPWGIQNNGRDTPEESEAIRRAVRFVAISCKQEKHCFSTSMKGH